MRKLTTRAVALAALIGVGALTLGTAGQAATSDDAETTTVMRGDLTQTLSWTGELAYANQTSLSYKSGASDAGGLPQGGAMGSAAFTGTRLAAALEDPTPTPSPSTSPSPTPTTSPTPSPSSSPSATPTAPAGPTSGTPSGCACMGAGTVVGGAASGSSSGSAGVATPETAAAGLVTWLPQAGATVASGGALYRVDNEPVVLLEGTATLYRDLTVGDTGADVAALESALAALGYGSTMTVDGTFTAATSAALEDFQDAVGIEATGDLDLTTVVMHDGPVVISTLVAAVGDEATNGLEILVVADPARDVTLALDPAQLTSIAVGDTVTVTLLDGSRADATVSLVASAPAEDGTYALTARLDPAVSVAGDHLTVDVTYSRLLVSDALLVDPYSLVLLEGDRTVVRVRKAEGVVDVEVTVIATAGRSTAVESAELAEGDIIES